MRVRSVDCGVDLMATACVRELLKLDLFAARSWIALVERPRVGEDGGHEFFTEGQRRDTICLVLPEVHSEVR